MIEDNSNADSKMLTPILRFFTENAIYSGIDPSRGGLVKLSIMQTQDRVCSSISNPLPAERTYQQRSGNRMPQDNFRRCSKLAHGDNRTMDNKKTTTATCQIPGDTTIRVLVDDHEPQSRLECMLNGFLEFEP